MIVKQRLFPSCFFSFKHFFLPFLFFFFMICLCTSCENDHDMNNIDKVKGTAEKNDKISSLWTCSMHPQIQLPKPGNCPICGMKLIPIQTEIKYQDKAQESLREIRLSPYAIKLAEIETSPVERKSVYIQVRMVGKIVYDETRLGFITAWVPGRIDDLYINFTGVPVRKGEPMVNLYSPKLYTAQSELIEAIRTEKSLRSNNIKGIRSSVYQTIIAAKDKLRFFGLSDNQIISILKKGKPSDHTTILSPISGTVIRMYAFEGMYVKTGTRIYTVADMSSVWAKLDAYESDIAWIRKGQDVEIRAEAFPGQIFRGEIAFIDPFLDPKTRTIKVRVNMPNKDYSLKPGMFVHAVVKASVSGFYKSYTKEKDTKPLVIPASAPLITGKRAVVYVADPYRKGVFEGKEIVLGPRAGKYYVVLNGLHEGELIVTHGNFKIDSSLQIQAKPSMMSIGGAQGGTMMHHGGMSMDEKKTDARSPISINIPAVFRHHSEKLIQAYNHIKQEIQGGNVIKIRKAFKKFKEILETVETSRWTGHLHMVWMELSMLMKNDSVIGANVNDMDEAKEVFATLTKHIDRMKSQFNILPVMHKPIQGAKS